MNTSIAKLIERESQRSLFSALLRARSQFGGAKDIAVDADGRTLTYNDIIQAAFGLGSAIARMTKRGENVGVLLPTGVGVVVTFFAVHAYGRVPAMLNFTAGPRNLRAACEAAQVTKVLTAHQFIELGNLQEVEASLKEHVELVYLEDVRESLSVVDKVRAVVGNFAPWLIQRQARPSDPGVILFTSGTEGDPKGVVLTHANVLANIAQINAHVTLETWDIIFNPLPTFHSYGLTAGTLFPIISGRKAVLHPSPLQVKIIPKRIRETEATILFATDSFLQQYARASSDDDLQSLRFAVCGAERVRDETRANVKRRFDLDVLEGYGVTETAPVLAVNQPGDIQPGTVGRMLPEVEVKLEPVEGLSDAGRLFVRGPNVMSGYLSKANPGEIQQLDEGWHDTGDVVSIDDDGYVTIRDRLKRFAKIGGEMVSLTVVENCASAIWPENMHAAVAISDKRKGEQIILLTDCEKANHTEMLAWARSHGVSVLAVPKRVIHVDDIPLLGTGKTNHVMVSQMAKAHLAAEEEAQAKQDSAQNAAATGEDASPATQETAAATKGDAGTSSDAQATETKATDAKDPKDG